MKHDEIIEKNTVNWDREVDEGGRHTLPWDLDVAELQAYLNGETDLLKQPYSHCYPREVYTDVAGKDVLCLASGGGQQSAVFGLLGANVTVIDICEGQLKGDRAAAERYGYEVKTVCGDMRDLSLFANESFDLIDQAISLPFVPDVRDVYREAHRVLKPGGLYHSAHMNPSTYYVSFDGPNNGWDGTGYRIAEPYRGGPILQKEDGTETMSAGKPTGEFVHLLSDIFNGLAELGFRIESVWEDPAGDLSAEPGSDEHMRAFIQKYFAITARKPS